MTNDMEKKDGAGGAKAPEDAAPDKAAKDAKAARKNRKDAKRNAKGSTAPSGGTPTRIKRAQAAGVATAILIFAVLIALVAVLAARGTGPVKEDVGTFTADWSNTGTTSTEITTNDIPDATYAINDDRSGTASLGDLGSVSWTAAAGDDVAVSFTNGLTRPMTGFLLTLGPSNDLTADDIRQLFIDDLGITLSSSISDDELLTWTPYCGATRYLAASDTMDSTSCTFGGHTVTASSMLDKYWPMALRVTMLSEDGQTVEMCDYDFTTNGTALSDLNTLGGWKDDVTIVPTPQELYYGFNTSTTSVEFTILGTSDHAADDYIALCEKNGWTVKESDGTVTTLQNPDDQYLTEITWSDTTWLAYVFVYLGSGDDASATATASPSAS